MKIKRILAMFITLSMVMGLVITTNAAENTNILALGDSISAGYGLASPEVESFTSIIDAEDNYVVTNKAVNGNTATGILAQIESEDITDEEIKAADIITITCGGNDMMALLYAKTAEIYNATYPDNSITMSEVANELINTGSDRRLILMAIALKLLDSNDPLYMMNGTEFADNLASFIATLNSVTEIILKKNPEVKIIVATQYNPYAEFSGATYSIISVDPVCRGMEAGVSALNTAIIENAENGVYTVADVKTEFDEYKGTEDLYVASPVTESFNLDFHPTAAGHSIIADTFAKAIAGDKTKIFADVHTAGHWSAEHVDYVYANGLMNGVTEDMFAPDENITRAMLVTVLYRNEGEPATNRSIPFADVDMGEYYANAVSWAKQNGIVNGVTENEFAPNENITREQFAAIIYRYAQYKNVAPEGAWAIRLDYADLAQISDYATEAVMYCSLKNIMQGKGDNFAPGDYATRAECAAILHRFIEAK